MKRVTLVPFLCAAACGGDHIFPAPDGMLGSAASCTMHGLLAVAVAGDFKSTGTLATLDPLSLAMTPNAVAGAAGDDPFVRQFDGLVYIINRADGDNVTILDACSLALVDQLATGASSNPQDVAVHGDKLYVPALGTAGVAVLTRGSANATPPVIDLGTVLGDPDGKPDCVSAYTVGDRVFVACGLLDQNFVPRGPGKIAVIDTATDTVATSFDLPYENPQNMIVQSPADSVFGGDLLVTTIPSFTDYSTGCLARVSTGATPAANGCALTNAALGGFQSHSDVQLVPNGELLWMAATTYDASFNQTGTLRSFDLVTGTLGAPVSPASELVVDVAACADGRVVIADETFGASGLRVYQSGVERTAMPLPIGLPPAFGNNIVCYDR